MMRHSNDRWWKRLLLGLLTLSTMFVLAGCPAPEGGVGGAEPGLEGEGLAGDGLEGDGVEGLDEEGGALDEETTTDD